MYTASPSKTDTGVCWLQACFAHGLLCCCCIAARATAILSLCVAAVVNMLPMVLMRSFIGWSMIEGTLSCCCHDVDLTVLGQAKRSARCTLHVQQCGDVAVFCRGSLRTKETLR